MNKVYSMIESIQKGIEQWCLFIAVMVLLSATNILFAQAQVVGPGDGRFEGNTLLGRFSEWDRTATPKMVLRVHGAGMLQTFADISAAGEFEIPLPEIPPEGNFGTLSCGDLGKGPIVQVTDFSLLTTLPGFSSPGRWDKGFSVIGMAFYADEAFSKNIGKPGGKRAQWLYSKADRIVEAGECNNTNSFHVKAGWNAFTVMSGRSGGPHTYNPGLDEDLGWYWSAFPEDDAQRASSNPIQPAGSDDNTKPPVAGNSEIRENWLSGEWNGVQLDTRMHMQLTVSGELMLENTEGGRSKTMKGRWSLKDGEFVLNIEEGVLRFSIEQISKNSFRLFSTTAGSDIVFTRKSQ